ncbi:MAG: N-acetylmuramoyl-L-alanine amidase [Clostridia bacterium]|nr:N-acetylmuramoyl-L-alanine amidase [Clostridia bacterium]
MNIIETNIKWASSLSKRPRTDYIVLHHAEASKCSVEQVDSWHKQNGWAGIGYHFFVRKDGTIYRGRPLDTMGAHVSGMNSRSIGICAEGSYMTETMPEAQKKAICELLVYLKDKYYPVASIVGHKEVGQSNCPGKNFPLSEIKNNYRNIAGQEYTRLNDIVWELNHRGIITDSSLWLKKGADKNIYWLLRKICQYVRTH